MKKEIKFLACALALVVSGAAYAEKYVVITHDTGSSPFWPVVQKGAEDAGKALGVEVEYLYPNGGDLAGMARIVEAVTAQKPAGIVISLPDIDVLGGVIKDAINAGIPVVSINSGGDVARELGVLFHVGQPEYEAGFSAGIKHKGMGVSKGICLSPEAFNVALEQRCNGYRDGIEGDVEMIDTTGDPSEIKARTSAALSKDDSISGILAVSPQTCSGALEALKELGREGSIPLGCFDLSDDIVVGIKGDTVDFAVDQQQYLQGYMPIVGLVLYNKYGLIPGGDILSGPGFVTKDNVALVEKFAGRTR